MTRDDDSGPCLTSELKFNAEAGKAYEILIDGFGRRGTGGEFTVQWSLNVNGRPVPVIVDPLRSRAVTKGKDVILQITTESPDDLFQWYFNGVPIPGADDLLGRPGGCGHVPGQRGQPFRPGHLQPALSVAGRIGRGATVGGQI